MLRLFRQHDARHTETLNGLWDLVIGPEREDKGGLPGHYNRKVYVPSAWETLPGLENYRGKGWLRRHFTTRKSAVRLVFGAVSHSASVYIDGRRVGHHYDGFVPWDLVVPEVSEGDHELVVEVDNSFGRHSALHGNADHFTSGGITRPAELQTVPPVFIKKVLATPARTGRGWALRLRLMLANLAPTVQKRRVTVEIAGVSRDFGNITMSPGGERDLSARLATLKVKPWSAESPVLYDMTVRVLDGNETVDDLTERVGFRQVKVQGSKFLLNGKSIRLRGYNRHESHGSYGHSLPVEAMAQDLEILKDLGCNFIRTSHYPNDMRFLDLCDETGFYVWEETNSTSVPLQHPKYREQIDADARTMVEWHFNHPSIVIWGTLNECGSSSRRNRREHGRMLDYLRELDGSRPVTFASNAWQKDVCLEFPDIVSWNWYEGWYWGTPGTIEQGIEKLLAWQDSHTSRGGAGKPVIISEFGASGLYGTHQRAREKWSEEYQSDVLDESLRVYLNHPRICGVAIWQFCDVRTSGGRDANGTGKPNSRNSKGTVDEYRRPKTAYDAVKHRMHEARRKFGR